MKTMLIDVRTGGREAVLDITAECARFAREASGGGDGLLHVFVPHATAGLAIIETGAGSDDDLLRALDDLLPNAVSYPRPGVSGSAVYSRFSLTDQGYRRFVSDFGQAQAGVQVPGARELHSGDEIKKTGEEGRGLAEFASQLRVMSAQRDRIFSSTFTSQPGLTLTLMRRYPAASSV